MDSTIVSTPEGLRLRVGEWRAPGPHRGTVVILAGRSEFLEKYEETAGDLTGRGFYAVGLDWRGQGLSEGRLTGNPQVGYVRDMMDYVSDLETVLTWVESRRTGPVWFLAHSMGGHIALRYLAEGRPVLGPSLKGAILSAPMISIRLPYRLPGRLVGYMAQAAVRLGQTSGYVPGQGPYIDRPFENNPLTGDRTRFRLHPEWCLRDQRLATGGPGWPWLSAVLKSSRILMRAAYLKQITLPVLIAQAGQDRLVSAAAQNRAALALPCCRLIRYPDARHEILMETDELRARFWDDVDRFISDYSRPDHADDA